MFQSSLLLPPVISEYYRQVKTTHSKIIQHLIQEEEADEKNAQYLTSSMLMLIWTKDVKQDDRTDAIFVWFKQMLYL
jgi:hypothetical protein